MITIQKAIDLPDTYPLHRIGQLEYLLFFDIETTGFSGDYSNLYLIGCTYYKNQTWNLIQWFADTPTAEEELLHAFFAFLSHFSVLIHFNGDGFDIPYLLKRCHYYHLTYDFSDITSLDLYKKIKPYKNLLQLENMKQKSIERFLGIFRLDQYSGGQLIEVYQDYLYTRESVLYDMLILHNEEDLKGMPLILPILNYPDFLEHNFTLIRQECLALIDVSGTSHPKLQLVCESEYHIPVPFKQEKEGFSCSAEDSHLIINIPLYQGILKYFYPNYRDYYYLIYEDTAIHKSIAAYVDKSSKVKATAKNCYIKKEGCFLPQLQILWEPALRQEPKDKMTYVDFDETLLTDPVLFQTYLRQLFQYLLS